MLRGGGQTCKLCGWVMGPQSGVGGGVGGGGGGTHAGCGGETVAAAVSRGSHRCSTS
jgi:hypothetical protein